MSQFVWPVAVVLFLWHVWYLDYTPDDAYITFRFASNWVDGMGIVFNPGEFVEGYTNFLWLSIAALALRLGLDVVVVCKLLGVISGLIGLYLAIRLTEVVSRDARYPCFAALILAAHGTYAVWCVSALETGFYAMLVALSLYLALRKPRRDVLASLVLALVVTTRPDGYYFMFVAVGLRWLLDRVFPRRLLYIAMPLGIVHNVWRWLYYGTVLPNTMTVRMGHGETHWYVVREGLAYVGRFAIDYELAALFLCVAGLFIGAYRRSGRLLLVSLIPWFAYVALVGGDPNCFFRFFVPITPLLCALAVGALATVIRRTRWNTGVLTGCCTLWVLLLLVLSVIGAEKQTSSFALDVDREAMRKRLIAAEWMKRNLPADSNLATAAVGAMPYITGFYTIDVLGVTDRHIASHDLKPGTETAHGKTDGPYVWSKSPTVLADPVTWRYLGWGEQSPHWGSAAIPGLDTAFVLVDSRVPAEESIQGEVSISSPRRHLRGGHGR